MVPEYKFQNKCWAVVLFVVSQKGIPSKVCSLSCFVWLKSILFKLLCVSDPHTEPLPQGSIQIVYDSIIPMVHTQ